MKVISGYHKTSRILSISLLLPHTTPMHRLDLPGWQPIHSLSNEITLDIFRTFLFIIPGSRTICLLETIKIASTLDHLLVVSNHPNYFNSYYNPLLFPVKLDLPLALIIDINFYIVKNWLIAFISLDCCLLLSISSIQLLLYVSVVVKQRNDIGIINIAVSHRKNTRSIATQTTQHPCHDIVM
jgi:hypothetical protein